MQRVRLIHWHAGEAENRVQTLQALDVDVEYEPLEGAASLRVIWEAPPSSVVIDLGRLPSQGRDVALFLRKRKATRHVPIVFVGGDSAKIDGIQNLLPEAVFTTWSAIGEFLPVAMANPPENPTVPRSTMDGYSGTPLWKKLRIKPHSTVTLVGAPPDFVETIGQIPADVTFRRRLRDSPKKSSGSSELAVILKGVSTVWAEP